MVTISYPLFQKYFINLLRKYFIDFKLKIFCFSYDAREHSWNQGTRWSDEFQFGDRAYFDLNRQPAALIVENIRPEEAGIYRCRVDFKSAPTRNTLVNLTLLGENKNY